MNVPFKHYLGGKGCAGTYQQIINRIPPHVRLIIPFAGNCAIARNIKPALNTLLFDLDKNVIAAWENSLKNSTDKNRYHITLSDGTRYIDNNKNSFNCSDVVYCDPPYPLNTRRSRSTKYKYDFTDSDHLSLLMVLLQLKCPVLISTYPNKLYNDLLKDWRKENYYSTTRKGRRLESLFMNFENPGCYLHDYSFAGKNYRDRERIKKKVDRYYKKFNNMNPLERNAIFEKLSGPIPTNGDDTRRSH